MVLAVFLPSKILHGPDVGRTLEMGEFLRAGSLRTISVLFARAPLREPGTSTDLRVSCVGAPVPFVAAETMMYHPNVGRIVLALRDLTDSALFASTTQKLVESVHLEQVRPSKHLRPPLEGSVGVKMLPSATGAST